MDIERAIVHLPSWEGWNYLYAFLVLLCSKVGCRIINKIGSEPRGRKGEKLIVRKQLL